MINAVIIGFGVVFRRIKMHKENVRVLIGGECELAKITAKYLEDRGLNVKSVETNPLSIQFEAMRHDYDVVLIYHRTKFSKSLCENLKNIDNPPSLILLSNNCDEQNGFSGLEGYFDAFATIPDQNEYLYRKIVDRVKIANRKKASVCSVPAMASLRAAVSFEDKAEFALHNVITNILTRLCVTPRYNGYNYIREAVKLAVADAGSVKGISKQIYPEVAAELGVTASGVERSIRTAIHRAWEKAEPSVKVEIFGTDALKSEWIPTNSEFIYIIADKISCEMNKPSV